jgi:signal transduction histidine kinase
VALHARVAKRQRILDVGTKRQLPLRLVLFVLAFVPSAAMVALLAINSGQLYSDWNAATSRENSVVVRAGAVPTLGIFYSLEAERQLSAATLANPSAYKASLAQVRKATDSSATALESLSNTGSPSVAAARGQIDALLRQLPAYRAAVDQGGATQQQVYDDYNGLVTQDLGVFTALSQTGVAVLDVRAASAMAQVWGTEMISREDAVMTAGAVAGYLTPTQRAQIDQAAGAQRFIYENEVIPFFPAQVSDLYRKALTNSIWQQKTGVEQALIDASAAKGSGNVAVSAALGQQWRQVMSALTPELQQLTQVETGYILSSGNSAINSLKTRLITNTVLGALGVLLVVGLTLWLTGVLRRRIFALRSAALDMQVRLPDVVERLRRGETVDPDAELPELSYGRDELGMLGQALNAARSTAVETAVRQVEQYRGFERLLQRIARRTQLLIGLQMKRLTEMERRHEDAEVLEGLFDLDHLTARLRRYEENLVILGGGQPQRRWRKPVPLLDVLRSAQGEVQDYRRIRIETDSRTWLSERAVGAMVHVLAELMENAVAFSKPPTPVEVSASRVARGLAIEIEDRGMGMEPEQYAEANALMADPPRMDVISRADDARLGLYVVARLVAGLGVKVELRPSSFGGTRVVVLVPSEFVIDAQNAPVPAPEEDFAPPRLSVVAARETDPFDFDGEASSDRGTDPWAPRGYSDRREAAERPLVGVGARNGNGTGTGNGNGTGLGSGNGNSSPDPAPEPRLDPLPRRVRLASLVTELREPRYQGGEHDASGDPEASAPPPEPRRSGAAVGAFQRQSRIARLAAQDDEQPTNHPSPGREPAPEEDGR